MNTSTLKQVLFNLVVLTFLLLNSNRVSAADYYWVNGTGNWSDHGAHWATTSGGMIFHTTIPTLNDDVFFDANSFTATNQSVVMDSTFIYCHTMDWSAATFNPQLIRQSNIKVNVYGSLVLSDSMYMNLAAFHLLSDSLNNDLYSGNVSIDSLYFDGSGTWDLTGPLNCDYLDFKGGVLNSSGYNLDCIEIYCSPFNTNQITLNLDNSVITFTQLYAIHPLVFVKGASSTFITNNIGGIMFLQDDTLGIVQSNGSLNISGNAVAREINVTGNLSSGNSSASELITAGKITVGGNLNIESLTTDSLFILSSGVTLTFDTLTINDVLQIQGTCEKPVILKPSLSLNNAVINSPSTNFTIDFVIIKNIQSIGGGTFTATNSYSIGNATGWIINSPASRDLYWIGSTGYWNDSANWAVSSGGAGGNCPPSPIDNVNFDVNSFTGINDTVWIYFESSYCNNMDWTGATGFPIFYTFSNTPTKINGSIICNPAMKIWSPFEMTGSDTSFVTTNGLTIPGITFTGTGTFKLTDNLTVKSVLNVENGTFQTDNHLVNCNEFIFGSNWDFPVVDLGASTIYCTERFTGKYNQNFTLIGNNANVILNDTIGGTTLGLGGQDLILNDITFITKGVIGGGITCNNIIAYEDFSTYNLLTANSIFIGGNATIDTCITDTLYFNNPGKFIKFKKITINEYSEINGQCGLPVSLEPAYGVTNAVLQKNTDSLNIDYCNLTNITATGGAVFVATNCNDLGGNTGWSISSPASRNLYWVGGTGNWSDPNHWSLSSGGAGGICLPGPFDNVYFDANSFLNVGDSLIIDQLYSQCHDFDWSNATNNPYVKINSGIQFVVSGSVKLAAGMNFATYNNSLVLNSTEVNSITSNGVYLPNTYFRGGGTWNLNDNIYGASFYFNKGTFNTNDFDVHTIAFRYASLNNVYDTTYYNLGTSKFYLNEFYIPENSTGMPELFFNLGNNQLISSNLNFSDVTFLGNAIVQGNMSINDLVAFNNINMAGDINTNTCIAHKDFTFSGGAGFTTNDIIFKGNVTMSSVPTQIFIGSMHLDNPGKTVSFKNIFVSDYITTTASGGFPVLLQGYNGIGTITKGSGIVCLDHLLLKDVNATGGALFFAGASSVDLGGNSGWTYTTCNTQPPDVWPGDANYDLTANNFDVLNVGLAFSASGPIRTGASIAWVAQPASDWSAQFGNAANLKHADTDGNGAIENADTTAISINYGLTHPLRLSNPGSTSLPGAPLYVIATPDTVMEGDTVQIDIFLGTAQIPVDSIYGLAFTIEFDSNLIDTTYMPFDYSVGWMGVPGVDLLTFEKKFLSQGKVDVAITRTDHLNLGGAGIIVSTGVVIIDNIGARLSVAPPFVPLPISISNVRAVTASEYYFSLNNQGTQVEIDTLGSTSLHENLIPEDDFIVFPNPGTEEINIYSVSKEIIKLELSDNIGVVHQTLFPRTNKLKLDTHLMSSGIYFLKITTSKKVVVKRVVISNK